ncbi:YobA family protein [Thalassobacillus sp. CUG 92003]|uniref:YobA family protein n=1 Tax=Thalassobacillus sp. CUG 92003 TaxID=2736641 RepID=UPI0015E77E17|nr:YobA family protein [Thalassobacillus sp. CUG 92003]
MTKKFVFSIGILLILVGCTSPDITGYIMDKKNNEILVVATESEDTGETKEFYDAVWARDAPGDVKIGEQVDVWYDGPIAESYPGQTSAGRVDVIPSSILEGATLSDAEALNKALTQQRPENGTLTVRSISYEADQDEWSIKLKNTIHDDEYMVRVNDKQ